VTRDAAFTPPHLTDRQREVLGWLHAGYPPADIARLMSVSVHTVRDYCKTLRTKFGVGKIAQVLTLAETAGMFPELPEVAE
jgi:DNA-binding CsgD family transcriptional regulator